MNAQIGVDVAPSSAKASTLARDIGLVLLAVLILSASTYITSRRIMFGAPPTAQLIVVPLLAIFIGRMRSYIALAIFFALFSAELPVVPTIIQSRFAIFQFWWVGACLGYYFAIFIAGRLHGSLPTRKVKNIIGVLSLATIAIAVPHFLWAWSRFLEYAFIPLAQCVLTFVALTVIVVGTRRQMIKRTRR